MSKPSAILATTVPVTLLTFHTGTARAMQERGYAVTLVSSPGTELRRATELTLAPAQPLRMSRTISPFRDALALFQWLRLLRRVRPRLVIAATPKCGLLAMTSAALMGVERRLYAC